LGGIIVRTICGTKRGALSAIPPQESHDDSGHLQHAAVHGYGDTLIKFVERADYRGAFAPGYEARNGALTPKAGLGLEAIDHVVGNVELGELDTWVKFFADTMDFTQTAHFDDKTISTEYSALMSKVMQDGTGRIKCPLNEPAHGRRKSQIAEFLEYNGGPGVQHVALSTHNIIESVSQLRKQGMDFLRVPKTYYERLEDRVGSIDEPLDRLAELGILVDRDKDGYLLQIFTQPVEDRPTMFFEIIERHGAQGFGEGNFKSLFESIEREQELRGNL